MNRRTSSGLRIAGCGLVLLALAACEGGRVEATAVAGARTADVGLLPVDDSRGVAADVGGVTHAYRGDTRVAVVAENRRDLSVVSQANDADSWVIEALTVAPGEYACGDDGLQISLMRGGQPSLHSAQGGACALTVTQANERAIAGFFEATLTAPNGTVYAVDGGGFRFELAHVIPDSDADGLADADDNCPFDANPDQADANGNGVGSACDASEEE